MIVGVPKEIKDKEFRVGMVIKVKEPLPIEYELLRAGQILFTYLHLAPAPCPAPRPLRLPTSPFPLVKTLAGKGLQLAVIEDIALRRGINVYLGRLICPDVAESRSRMCEELPF